MIQLQVLGRIELRDSRGVELGPVLAQPKRLALLAYLAINSRLGFRRRDEVLAVFWPDHDAGHARAALNRAVYHLRQTLGAGVLVSRGAAEIGLSAQHFQCDAVALERAVSEGRFEEAVDLYRGDLLEAFHVSDASPFEHWLDGERDRLRALAHRAATALVSAESPSGDPARAAHWLRWTLERFPYDEPAVRRLIVLLNAAGDRAGALQHYDQFARRMANDLDLSPSAETRALRDELRVPDERVPAHRAADAIAELEPVIAGAGPETSGSPAASRPSRIPDLVIVGQTVENGVIEAPAARRIPFKRTLAVAAPAAAMVGALLFLPVARRGTLDAELVGIVPIRNMTDDPAYDRLARTVTDWIERSVSEVVEPVSATTAGPHGRVIEIENVSGTDDRAAPRDHARILVSGEIASDNGYLRAYARVSDATHGGGVWAVPPVTLDPTRPDDAIREIRRRIAGAVAALLDPRTATLARYAASPPYPEALAEFIRASEQKDRVTAARHFQRAAEIDTTFIWAILQAAILQRSADPVTTDSVLRAFDSRRGRLTSFESDWLSWALASNSGNRLEAYQAASRAADRDPGFTYQLARNAWDLHRPRESLELLDRVPAEPGRARGRTPGWTLRAESYHELARHGRELAVARRARDDRPDGLDALWHEVRARAALGQVRRVEMLFDSALSAPTQAGYNPGNVMLMAAEELRAHGEPRASEEALHRAIDWYRTRPPETSLEHDYDLAHLGGALYLAGEYDEAEVLLRQVAASVPKLKAEMWGRIGAMAVRRGDRAAAVRILRELARFSIPAEGDAYEVGMARARIHALLGDDTIALELLRNAVGAQGIDLHTDIDFQSMARLPAYREFVRPKG
jgi:DNA-binding SARP family transcriptional activator/TolB-like protein